MKDPSVPSIVLNTEQQIDITFSQVPDNSPQFASENNSDAPTDIVAATTQTQVADQGYTYNQVGFTYNQPGWMYGGIYNQNADVAPAFANDTATLLNPSISSIIDIGTPFVPPPAGNSGMLIGPGLPWQFLTYP